VSNPVGRPPLYTTAEAFDAKVDEYFISGRRTAKAWTKEGVEFEIPKVTLTGLIIFLGFADKQSFYDYEKKPEFTCSVKRARVRIEREYEERLENPACAGSIFALKNFGWTDRQDVALQNPDGSNLLSPDIIAAAVMIAKQG
jgi:hypothetical protein